jgi:diguanylate cyclase (GGDEF)-like protein
LLDTEVWLLDALGSLDEAWRTAEALDTCGADTGWPFFQAQAALMQGQIASQHGQDEAVRARAVAHFDRAKDLVAPGRGRYLRSLVAYSAGGSLGLLGLTEPALAHMRQALAISVDLQDAAGIAAARIEIAQFSLNAGRPAEALASLDAVERLLKEQGAGAAERLIRVHALQLRAMAQLRRGELAKLLERTSALDVDGLLPANRRELVLARAEAQAALGRYADAYASMRQARELDDESRALGRDAQVLQLQARYDTSQRDAEIAALRHEQEATRLAVQAQAATQRGLWAAVLALLAGGVAAGVLGWRSLQRRRELTDLALRDELTGLPNRRAIQAYARAQIDQARRLGLPLALALIDLDHFKQVNDRFGHPIGDALLRALGEVAPPVLRASDRLGRWGGEEFLLVLPGTQADELGAAFDRLLAAFARAEVDGLPKPHGVSFSMGTAVVDQRNHDTRDADYDALLERADRRLYQAKREGRSTWR